MTLPADDHQARITALFDLVAPDYDQHVPFFRAYADELVPWLGVGPGQRVVDIGTGRGALASRAQALGAFVLRIDTAIEMLRLNPGSRAAMDGQLLAIRSDSADVAMGAFSIHLFPDPARGVAEAARVLRPGGIFGLALFGRSIPGRWDFYMQTISRYAQQATEPALMPPPVPFGRPETVLGAVGLVDVESRDCEIHVPVEDPDTFLRGEKSHGYRSLFESLAPAARAKMEEELRAQLEGMHSSGGIVLDRVATFVRGRKPER